MADPGQIIALIVDDNRLMQSLLVDTVRQLLVPVTGVVTAANGREAVDRYREIAIRSNGGQVLILLDLDLPVMGGLEALALIRRHEQERRLPPSRIVVVSALDADNTRQLCYANGADAFYPKPVRPDELLRFLQEE